MAEHLSNRQPLFGVQAWNNSACETLLEGDAETILVSDDFRRELVKLLPRLQRFTYALTGTIDQGDDLVQEACAKALANQEQWRQGTKFDSWIFRIAHNAWLDRVRATKVRNEVANHAGIENVSGVDGRDVVENRQKLTIVMQGIAKLPEEQRVVIALVCVDGLSYKEAAAIIDSPIGTVMSRLARARKTLHDLIDYGPAPNPENRHD